GHNFRLQIIGDGELRHQLRCRVADCVVQDWVSLLGALPHEKVRLSYERASIFALPCVVATNGDRDGLPNVLLEAMACGLPVVSTLVAGIPGWSESERDGLLGAPGD